MIFSTTTISRFTAKPLAVLVLAFFMAGCNPFKSFEYRGVSDWKIQAKSFAESKLSAKIYVFNPNKYQVTIKRIEAEILVNGSQWSKYQLDSSFVVPAESVFTFPIDLRVKNSSLITGLSKLASGNELPYEMKGKIKGTYRSITAEIPFNYADKFSEEDIRF
jgi:LEA14-like dessication related protein